jgi:hypothetical protein
MPNEIFQYLAQDFAWNAEDGHFLLTLHSDSLPHEFLLALNQTVEYECVQGITTATFHLPQFSAVVHCKCKQGHPTGNLAANFEVGNRLTVHWPGATRIFARVRIMDAATPDNMISMLLDDIESGHSRSDVESPETNQSFRPWSDEEDSETDTLGDEG